MPVSVYLKRFGQGRRADSDHGMRLGAGVKGMAGDMNSVPSVWRDWASQLHTESQEVSLQSILVPCVIKLRSQKLKVFSHSQTVVTVRAEI